MLSSDDVEPILLANTRSSDNISVNETQQAHSSQLEAPGWPPVPKPPTEVLPVELPRVELPPAELPPVELPPVELPRAQSIQLSLPLLPRPLDMGGMEELSTFDMPLDKNLDPDLMPQINDPFFGSGPPAFGGDASTYAYPDQSATSLGSSYSIPNHIHSLGDVLSSGLSHLIP